MTDLAFGNITDGMIKSKAVVEKIKKPERII